MVQGWNDGSEDYNVIHRQKERIKLLEEAARRLLLYVDDPSRHDCGTDGIAACAWCSLHVILEEKNK